jgi:hypothetical protein
MPIQLITGTPGAGKTTLALELLCEAAGLKPRSFKTADALIDALRQCKPPRPIYTWNVSGLVDDLPFKPIEDLLDWQSLPDGALILGDEAWEAFGTQTDAKKDPRALELAKHRHRGMDFILTAQHPSQLSTFLRSLVGEHVHVSRRFGTKMTQKFTWTGCCDDPNGLGNRKRGSEVVWTHHRPVQGLYRSATIHTVQRKFPARVLALPLLAVLAIGAGLFGASKVKAFVTPKAEPVAAAQRSEQPAPGAVGGTAAGTSRNDSRGMGATHHAPCGRYAVVCADLRRPAGRRGAAHLLLRELQGRRGRCVQMRQRARA